MKDLIASIRGSLYSFLCNRFRQNISVGSGLKIYDNFKIAGRGKLEIGDNCTISCIKGDSSQFVCIDTLRPDSFIKIGDNVALYSARIAAKFEVVIGNNVLIEESTIMDTDFHSIDRDREDPEYETREKCKVHIGNNVSIGARSAVMKGVTIGDNASLLPGSVVVNAIKPDLIVTGNPAKPFVRNPPN